MFDRKWTWSRGEDASLCHGKHEFVHFLQTIRSIKKYLKQPVVINLTLTAILGERKLRMDRGFGTS